MTGDPASVGPERPRRVTRLRAVLELLHAGPSAATVGAAAGFMVLLGGGIPPLGRLGLVVLMVALQQAAISLHNDWCDRELDAQAKPWRAIPAGLVSATAVRMVAWLGAGLALLTSAPLGPAEFTLNLAGLAAGFAYNAGLKATPLSWLPFAVAFPLLPLFGAAALDRWPHHWWSLFIVGLPVVLTIHLADTLPDLRADAAGGSRGLAHTLGERRARRLSLAALGLAAVLVATGGVVLGHSAAIAAGVLALLALFVAFGWPGAQRLVLTAGAAACGLGWLAMLS